MTTTTELLAALRAIADATAAAIPNAKARSQFVAAADAALGPLEKPARDAALRAARQAGLVERGTRAGIGPVVIDGCIAYLDGSARRTTIDLDELERAVGHAEKRNKTAP